MLILSILHTPTALFTPEFFFIPCIVRFPFMIIYPHFFFHVDSINICYGLTDLLILHGLDIYLLGKKGMLEGQGGG